MQDSAAAYASTYLNLRKAVRHLNGRRLDCRQV
jgi:hypothetical protein